MTGQAVACPVTSSDVTPQAFARRHGHENERAEASLRDRLRYTNLLMSRRLSTAGACARFSSFHSLAKVDRAQLGAYMSGQFRGALALQRVNLSDQRRYSENQIFSLFSICVRDRPLAGHRSPLFRTLS